jgi:hypothetical protein
MVCSAFDRGYIVDSPDPGVSFASSDFEIDMTLPAHAHHEVDRLCVSLLRSRRP